MSDILEVVKNAKGIMSGPVVNCGCGESWFSPFDKLFVSAYGKCSMCCPDEELERLGNNIFAIIEAV